MAGNTPVPVKSKGAPAVGAGSGQPAKVAPAPLPTLKPPKTRDMLPGSAEHAAATGTPPTVSQIRAARLAQVVNLHIAGYSLADIGAAIGATSDEVDRMIQQDAARYVRTQPALRTYVRNWVSDRYTQMLDSVWDGAVDPNQRDQLERQDRALRILDRMAKLHGAEAPTQTEVKVEAAPEAVEKLVAALASAQGLGYDVSVFDVVDAELVEQAVVEGGEAVVVSGNAVAEPRENEEPLALEA